MTDASIQSQENDSLSVLFVGSPPIDLQAACASACEQAVDIDVVTDGRAALHRLTAATESPSGDSPDLVLLQFGFELPDGMTLLHAIKSSPRLGTLPVVVLDPDATGVDMTYEIGGNAYIRPPDSPGGYTNLIDSIATFWVGHAQYPGESLYSNG
jgi:CheY-like chemotaxis protein